MNFAEIMAAINNFVWGPVMLALLMGTGIFLTVRLKFLPWRNLGYALKSVFKKPDPAKKEDKGDISPFQSLMTALAATIGTGNIVGVATAMVLGGPGALVWMWISALFGLSTKYGESVLAVKYRETNAQGEMAGGPMYAMKNGFKIKWIGSTLAVLFSIFAVVASFGIGNMTQANSIANAVLNTFGVPTWITGLIITSLALVVLLGGIKSIGKVSGILVPFMAVFYFAAGVLVILINIENVPAGLAQIFSMAFSPTAIAGGVGGSIIASMLTAMRWGVARGVFSNEAGLGSAPIAAAAAKTDKFVFIASGTGIAPFHSMVLTYPDIDYTLIHGVRHANESYDRHEYASDRYILCTSRDQLGTYHGRLTGYLINCTFNPQTHFYLCGNSDMIFDALEILKEKGFERAQIHCEVYF